MKQSPVDRPNQSSEARSGSAALRYVLVTPARNEETHIERTIQSMIAQSVSGEVGHSQDGSSDGTPDIIDRYASQHDWIERVDMPAHRDRNFASKAHCFNQGYERVRHLDFEVIGNLDADLLFDPEYLEFILGQFAARPELGVAGTVFREDGYDSGRDSFEGENHVAGGCQLFRRRCFQGVGGTCKSRRRGELDCRNDCPDEGLADTIISGKVLLHHPSLGTAERSGLAALFSYGEKDYYLGNHPLWQLFRVAYRFGKKPRVTGSLALAAGNCGRPLDGSDAPYRSS